MGRYKLDGIKKYKVRMTSDHKSQVFIEPEWIPFAVIEGLNQLEGNKLLDEHYESLYNNGNSKEFIGRIEEFRQRYNRDKVHYVRNREDDNDIGI